MLPEKNTIAWEQNKKKAGVENDVLEHNNNKKNARQEGKTKNRKRHAVPHKFCLEHAIIF